jgi:DNA-binding MarR family transcriptional regulator
MAVTPQETARELLEIVPLVMRDIRSQMRSRRSPDLTIPQFRALAFLNRNEGSSLLKLANHMGLTPPSTCRLMDGLIARGMVTRQDNPADRRCVQLVVTSNGISILDASTGGTLAYLAGKLGNVGANDREVIVKAMKSLRSVFASSAKIRAVVE